MGNFTGKKVLITGGASGIGLCTAKEFAKAGADLILTDIDKEALATAKAMLSNQGHNVKAYQVDVSDQKAVEKMIKDVKTVDILINNAGLGLHGELKDVEFSTWKKLFDVNFWGPLYHIYALLPSMKERGNGQIVNVSSGQAFLRLPTWGAYSVAKLALGGFSEILHYEVKQHGINVTTIYPYMVNSGFYNEIDGDNLIQQLAMKLVPLYSLTPEAVAKRIVDAVEKKQRIEDTHFLTSAFRWLQVLPLTNWLVNSATSYLLTNQTERGFSMDEVMAGEHQFEAGEGPAGKHAMHFKATWGPRNIVDWLNPTGQAFMTNDLEGTVTVEGLCTDAPCQGQLEMRYFDEQKIRYTFDFEVEGKEYHYVGEKVDIKPWNLHVSHTTCFGELREKKTDKLISRSITYFHFNTTPEFLGSFRLTQAN